MKKKDNTGKKSGVPDNILAFPGTPMPAAPNDLDVQVGIPEVLEFYLPRALEFAYLTAEEVVRLIEELLGEDNEMRDRFEKSARAEIDKLRQDPRAVCDALDVILVKIQGLALIIPPSEILLPLLPEMEDLDGFFDLHEVTETCAETISEILTKIMEEAGPLLWSADPVPLKNKTIKSKKTRETLDTVALMISGICSTLDDALDLFYEMTDE